MIRAVIIARFWLVIGYDIHTARFKDGFKAVFKLRCAKTNNFHVLGFAEWQNSVNIDA